MGPKLGPNDGLFCPPPLLADQVLLGVRTHVPILSRSCHSLWSVTWDYNRTEQCFLTEAEATYISTRCLDRSVTALSPQRNPHKQSGAMNTHSSFCRRVVALFVSSNMFWLLYILTRTDCVNCAVNSILLTHNRFHGTLGPEGETKPGQSAYQRADI